MRILAIDSGNTRLKWGLWDAGGGWTRVGALGQDELRDDPSRLAAAVASLAAPKRIVIANVAGAGIRAALERALAGLSAPVTWACSMAAQCGVTSLYARPETLGADRWAALIGAWHRERGACLVVCAGTATTADMLSAAGEFRGGVILPGLDLMKRALAENTALLPLAEGAYAAEPRGTADAIETGALHAQAGAIERVFAQVKSMHAGRAACLLSGGAAARIAGCLSVPHQVLDHLVLDGLVHIAGGGAA